MQLTSQQWKFLLGIVGLLIVGGSAYSASYLVKELAEEESKKVKRYLEVQTYLNSMSDEEAAVCNLTMFTDILQSNTTIPLVIAYEDGHLAGTNFGAKKDDDAEFLQAQIDELEAAGITPMTSGPNKIYYFESRLLRALRFFPFLQLALIGSFILLGYFALNAIRRSEQNRVWVGMAKETAHQLGTPISAIMAWGEFLRSEYADNPELNEVAEELTRDTERLQLVANRFNKIGSAPELTPQSVFSVVSEVYDYMSKRAPRKVEFTFKTDPACAKTQIAVNANLFQWVLENLIRNSLDAMDGTGTLRLTAHLRKDQVEIDVIDSGKGIPSNKRKAVFRPGYTTKSRGWGLGLSLAKRIIEEYHGGKIFVKDSVVGKGSTFCVRLPVAS